MPLQLNAGPVKRHFTDADEEHFWLLKERLSRATPGSKAHAKLKREHDRVDALLKERARKGFTHTNGRRPHAGGTQEGAFHEGTKTGWKQWRPWGSKPFGQNKRGNVNEHGYEERNDPFKFSSYTAREKAVAGAVVGAGVGYMGYNAYATAKEDWEGKANRKTWKERRYQGPKGEKRLRRRNKRRRNLRAMTAINTGFTGAAYGSGMMTNPDFVKTGKWSKRNTAIGGAVGAAIGFGFGHLQYPHLGPKKRSWWRKNKKGGKTMVRRRATGGVKRGKKQPRKVPKRR